MSPLSAWLGWAIQRMIKACKLNKNTRPLKDKENHDTMKQIFNFSKITVPKNNKNLL
jgi:hypothetical protein